MADTEKEKDAKKPDNKDQVALDLMRFIAETTGYGKGGPSAGFGGKTAARSPEEYADSLIQLFERCRAVVGKAG